MIDKKNISKNFQELPEIYGLAELLLTIRKEYKNSKIFFVGGIVRDIIMGRHSKDLDIVIAKISAKDLRKLLSRYGHVNLVGKSFGVFKFAPAQKKLAEPIDIALPRTEFSTGAGYRDFVIQSDPELPITEDLARRDFTINAIAFAYTQGKLIDPFTGVADISKKIIRAVGDPAKRFAEDYSRILRAVRLAVTLDFKIESSTWRELKKVCQKIVEPKDYQGKKEQTVPWETIAKEFLLAFDNNPTKTILLYQESGLLDVVLPEVKALEGVAQPAEFHAEGDVFVHTMMALRKLKKSAPLSLKLAVLLHDIGKPQTQQLPGVSGVERIRFNKHDIVGATLARQILARLKTTSRLQDKVFWLVKNHMLFVYGNVEEMRAQTIRKYFLDDVERGRELLELYRVDVAASVGPGLLKNIANYKRVKEYVDDAVGAFEKADLAGSNFGHLLSGQDIMQAFSLASGPAIGKYLNIAKEYVIDYLATNNKEPSKKEILDYLRSKIK